MKKLCAVIAILLSFQVQAGDTYPSIFYAAYNNDLGVATKYINSGSSIEIRDEHNRTPLMAAAEIGNIEMVVFLLEQGANQKVLAKGNSVYKEGVYTAIKTFNKQRQYRPAGWTR